LVTFFSIASSAAVTVPTGMTKLWSFHATGGGVGAAASDLNLTTSGATGTRTATTGTAAANAGASHALHPQ
jgi:hypothetical protein